MNKARLFHLPLVAAALLLGCQANPAHLGPKLSTAVHWYRDSAEQRLAYVQTYRWATSALLDHIKEGVQGDWAVILDIDETLIDNSEFEKNEQLAGKTKFDPAAWKSWVQARRAPPLPGALEFVRTVYALQGRVVLVTNREADECAATADNLKAAGIRFERLLCDTVGDGDKNPRFRQVQAGQGGEPPLNVLMWIGDNIGDFPASSQDAWDEQLFGVRYFVLPNPMYGSWTSRPPR